MNKRNIIITWGIITTALVIAMTISYAYFTANINNPEDDTTVSIMGGLMKIDYDGDERISLSNVFPKEDKLLTKNFTLTGNNTTGNDMGYEVYLVVENNTFRPGVLKFSIEGTNLSSNGTILETITKKSILNGTREHKLGEGTFSGVVEDIIHSYTLDIYFPPTGNDQNYNQDKEINAYIDIRNNPPKEELVIPDHYVLATDDDFTTGSFPSYIGTDEYVIIPKVIHGNTPTSAMGMFSGKKVKGVASLDNEITGASSMFAGYSEESLELKYFNSSKITDMNGMFSYITTNSIDFTGFDTSSVTDMTRMFHGTKVSELDLSSFDTSKVTNMNMMFNQVEVNSINLTSFDTSNVTNVSMMFSEMKVPTLDLSSFDTGKLTAMYMFLARSEFNTVDLSSFDTSNVTNMSLMFQYTKIDSIDLRYFDTSNATNMSSMFTESTATNINVSNFNTSNATNMSAMFLGTHLSELDLSSFDTSRASIGGIVSYGNIETVYVKNEEERLRFIEHGSLPEGQIILVKP